jgi:mono/diheme cytochrome c family protein
VIKSALCEAIMKSAAIVAAAVLIDLVSQSGYARETPPDQTGAVVFDHWCLPCHGAGPHHPGTAALEVKYKGAEPGALQARTDLDAANVKYVVRHGAGNMAPFRKTEITDAELDALAAYLSGSPHRR